MSAPLSRLDLPARRRRHARLIAALTSLIGACAEAAGAVYNPVAAAPPGQEGVEVTLLPCLQVSGAAALLLDRARAEDAARWPAAASWEREESGRTYAARCAVAHAQEIAEPSGPLGEHEVPLPTVEQFAAMGPMSAGDDVAARWRDDPQEAVALVRELVAGGELAVEEVLDEAVDSSTSVCSLVMSGSSSAVTDVGGAGSAAWAAVMPPPRAPTTVVARTAAADNAALRARMIS
ncbi:hypothetical protein [Streptomyces sp. NPDC088261]|uniref:hypothetical protein n=1 Tax=Streptomyces sp. NPDC088261 TaxID=3365851 RepID=UPI0037FC3E84